MIPLISSLVVPMLIGWFGMAVAVWENGRSQPRRPEEPSRRPRTPDDGSRGPQ